MMKAAATEQRGVCAGGKKPTARSIRVYLQLFKVANTGAAWRKRFFGTLKHRPIKAFALNGRCLLMGGKMPGGSGRQLLSFSISVQGSTCDSQGEPSNSFRSISAATCPVLMWPWEREVMRTGESSLYWLLSKLTTASCSGMADRSLEQGVDELRSHLVIVAHHGGAALQELKQHFRNSAGLTAEKAFLLLGAVPENMRILHGKAEGPAWRRRSLRSGGGPGCRRI